MENESANITKLEQGKAYFCKILRKTISEIDGQEYFLVQDCFETLHLVPTIYYQNYFLPLNIPVLFYVDKINCKGEIFLEPEHPYYKIGKMYDFEYLGKGKRVEKDGKEMDVLLIQDIFGRQNYVPAFLWQIQDFDFQPIMIRCIVERIKKSRLILVQILKP